MIFMPGVNLFLFNGMLVWLVNDIKRITKIAHDDLESWCYIPIIGRYLKPKEPGIEEQYEFRESLPWLNILINAFVLLPAIWQHRTLALPLSMALMWNLYIFQRICMFLLMLAWTLWWSNLRGLYYTILVSVSILINITHLMLIVDSMRMRRGCMNTNKQSIQRGAFPRATSSRSGSAG